MSIYLKNFGCGGPGFVDLMNPASCGIALFLTNDNDLYASAERRILREMGDATLVMSMSESCFGDIARQLGGITDFVFKLQIYFSSGSNMATVRSSNMLKNGGQGHVLVEIQDSSNR